MSLKVFHLVFIVLAIVLSGVCAYWSFSNETALIFGYSCVAAALALALYGVWFVRKAKHIIT